FHNYVFDRKVIEEFLGLQCVLYRMLTPFLVHLLLFLTSLCLSFLAEFEKSISNISLVIGKYVTSVNLVSLISCGK
ncbi:hypothetical protein AAH084_21470, partial [Bacteroides faecis]|uniref:hypothetical protein n=1 Tax=Bacteroides faecis TaxID=674529 RepID=UPI0039B471B4